MMRPCYLVIVLSAMVVPWCVGDVCAPSCAGVGESGTLVRDPSNCLQYYVCADVDGSGEFQLSEPTTCPAGHYFNDVLTTPKCDLIDEAHPGYCSGYCNPCKPLCTTPSSMSPNPSNCSSFITCLDGDIMIEQECSVPPYIYYDYTPGVEGCTDDDSVCFDYCDPCEAYCVEPGNVPDPEDCNKFYLCDPPNMVHFSCEEGWVFDSDTELCSISAACDPPCSNEYGRGKELLEEDRGDDHKKRRPKRRLQRRQGGRPQIQR